MNELVFWNGKKILVTGGLGFIGSNLALRLLELGAEITIYDCLDPRSGGNMPNIGDNRDSFKILVNDIRNFEALSNAAMGIDIIFNCAAYTSHPNSMKDPFNDIEVNCKGVMNLCEACRRFNPNVKIIHVGTSTQIGKMIKEPIDELHPEFPVDIYSANKTASEKYVLIYGSAYGMRTSVVRLANTFGPRSNISTPDFGFMNYFIGLGLKHRGILKALNYMAGSAAVVASPIGESYTAIRDGENGFLADSNKDWEERLQLLIDDSELRKKIAAVALLEVRKKHSRNLCFKKLNSVFEKAFNHTLLEDECVIKNT